MLASRENHNSIGETHDNQRLVEKFCPVGKDGEWWHIGGKDNPADRPTRQASSFNDVGKDWQRGKDFLWGPRSEWPIERRFATDRKAQIQIPTTEINQKYRNMLPSQQTVVSLSQLEVIAKKETELKVTVGIFLSTWSS